MRWVLSFLAQKFNDRGIFLRGKKSAYMINHFSHTKRMCSHFIKYCDGFLDFHQGKLNSAVFKTLKNANFNLNALIYLNLIFIFKLPTVCPIWIWLTLIAYYEEANYISALLKAELCMIFPYILIFEKNFWFSDRWFFTLKS